MAAAFRPQSGLEVVRHVAGIASTLYGAYDRSKCVVDGDVSVHLSCVANILQNLDIQHPVGHMVNDVVQNHHQTYGCGSKTLLMMLDLLAAAAIDLKDKGLDETTITRGLRQAVELSISLLPTLPLTNLFDQQDEHKTLHDRFEPEEKNTNINTCEVSQQPQNDDEWIEVYLNNPQPTENSQSSTEEISTPLENHLHVFPNNPQPNENSQGSTKKISAPLGNQLSTSPNNAHPTENSRSSTEEILTPLGNHLPANSLQDSTELSSSGIPFVKLRLKLNQKNLDFAESAEEEDDIGWYFDDGKVPEEDTMEGPVEELMNKMADIFDDFSNIGIQEIKPPDTTSPKEATYQQKQLEKDSSYSSLKDEVDDFDFENCFDDGSSSSNGVPPLSPNGATSNGKMSEKIVVTSRDDSDDEFDSCFDDVKFEVSDSEKKPIQDTSSVNFPLQKILNHNKKETILKEFMTKESEKDEDESLLLEAQFTNIMEEQDIEKGTQSLIGSVGSIKSTPSQTETKTLSLEKGARATNAEDFNAMIEAKLKSKKALKKGIVLNRSRHFRDIDSSLSELSSSSETFVGAGINSDHCSNGEKENISGSVEALEKSGKLADDLGVSSQRGEINTTAVSLVNTLKNLGGENKESLKKDANQELDESEDDVEKKLKKILESKPKLNISLLHRGSRHYRTMNDCDITSEVEETKENSQVLIPQFEQGELGATTGSTPISDSFSREVNPATLDYKAQSSAKSCDRTIRVVTEENLGSFILSLSHGDEEVVQMLKTVAWKQQKQSNTQRKILPLNELRFDPHLVHSVAMPGVASHLSGVVEGLVVPASVNDLELLRSPRPRRALLINGDVSENFQHRGMNAKPQTVVVSSSVSTVSREVLWLQNIVQTLEELSVSALLVKGKVSTVVRDHCRSHDIAVLSHVDTKELMAIAETAQVDMVQYVTECTQDNIAEDVLITAWSPDWSDQVTCLQHSAYALITTSEDLVQTVLVCHPSGDMARMVEERFWHAAYRLRNTLKACKVVIGGSDYHVAARLDLEAEKMQKSSDSNSSGNLHGLLPVVLESVAKGFRTLTQTVNFNTTGERILPSANPSSAEDLNPILLNCDKHSDYIPENVPESSKTLHDTYQSQRSVGDIHIGPSMAESCIPDSYSQPQFYPQTLSQQGEVGCIVGCTTDAGTRPLDDYTSKVEAYRSAVHLVGQILNTDYEVVTGLTGSQPPNHPSLVSML